MSRSSTGRGAISSPKARTGEEMATPARHGRRHILLIEDNAADAMLTEMVHKEVQHCSSLEIVESGEEAIEYLRGAGKYTDRRKPEVILMDMTLSAVSGLDLIGEIRALPGCQYLPIIMFSGTESPADLRRAYRLGANCVIRKSSNWDEYFRKLACCYEFWCAVVELAVF